MSHFSINYQPTPTYSSENKYKITPKRKKYKSMVEILAKAKVSLVENSDNYEDHYSDVECEQCGLGDNDSELLLCDKCDKAYHMVCVRPIVARVPNGTWLCPNCLTQPHVISFSEKKILDFFKIQKFAGVNNQCISSRRDSKKARRKRTGVRVHKKIKRRFLPYVPIQDKAQRMNQLRSLAEALTALNIEFSNELTYIPGMAPKSANQACFEEPVVQVLSKDDLETVERCRAMYKRGECPPLSVVYDSRIGYTVQADAPIKDMTFLTEYTGDVDYLKNRDKDDCDSLMTLLHTNDLANNLVICPNKRGNIARFISGINNHTPSCKKKQNLKCVRYNVNGECVALLVATRDIAKGDRLYYDYNEYQNEYPTHHFI